MSMRMRKAAGVTMEQINEGFKKINAPRPKIKPWTPGRSVLDMLIEESDTHRVPRKIRTVEHRPTAPGSEEDQKMIDLCLAEACALYGRRGTQGRPDTPSAIQNERRRIIRLASFLLRAIHAQPCYPISVAGATV